jgi:hypothetical protein
MPQRHSRRVRRLPIHDRAWHEAQMAQGPQGRIAEILQRKGRPVTWEFIHQNAVSIMTKVDAATPAQRALIHQFGNKALTLPEWNAKRSSRVSVPPEALGL